MLGLTPVLVFSSFLFLLVLCADAVHTQVHPYMSYHDHEAVIAEHEGLAFRRHPVHAKVQANLKPILRAAKQRSTSVNRWNPNRRTQSTATRVRATFAL